MENLEAFLAALGRRANFLEPLTSVIAWIFERRGFADVRGISSWMISNASYCPAVYFTSLWMEAILFANRIDGAASKVGLSWEEAINEALQALQRHPVSS